MTTATLTTKQARLLAFVSEFRAAHGVGPTVRAIIGGTDYRSTGGVDYALRKLKGIGLLDGDSLRHGTLSAGKHCATCTCGGGHG